MTEVFLLWHTHADKLLPGGEDVKLIGVCSTLEKAKDAQTRVSTLPGFKEDLSGFEICCYTLDEDNWIEGFIKVMD